MVEPKYGVESCHWHIGHMAKTKGLRSLADLWVCPRQTGTGRL